MGKEFKNKICSIICSYHPNIDRIKDLCIILSKFSTVVVVDNSQSIDKTFFSAIQNLIIITPEENLGTLRAYNLVIRQYPEFQYFWLWNQDTIITISAASEFISKSQNLFNKDYKLVATTFYDKKNWINPINKDEILIKESTTLFNILRLKSLFVDLFDENLFMDYGDWDLSIRIQKAGGKVSQIYGISHEHSFGDPEQTIIGSFNRSSETRLYLQGLNFAYLLRKRRLFPFINFLLLLRVFILPFKNLLFKNSYNRSKKFFLGIINGFRGETSSEYIAKLNLNK